MTADLSHVTLADNVSFENRHPSPGDVRAEILAGLAQPQKRINPKFFYDERGSELFAEITRLPEYYPTRTEVGILKTNSDDISIHCGEGCVLIEPGSGNSEKVRLLLEDLRPAAYVPMDISAEYLQQAALQLGEEYPWLQVSALCADFFDDHPVTTGLPAGKRVVFYPGSTIGNLEPAAAAQFLRSVARWVGEDGGVLIGVDLHKSSARLEAAYNDSRGITADFNLNMLTRLNALLDAEFELQNFQHQAFYDAELQRIEMHLVSRGAQQVRCNGATVSFRAGETIHTENSYKYSLEDFDALAAEAGLSLQQTWLDEDRLFSVHYLDVAS